MSGINDLRERINEADERLLAAFEARMEAARGIAEYKRGNSLPVYDAERERAVLERQTAKTEPEMRPYVERLYTLLFELSRDYQEKLLGAEKQSSPRNARRFGLLGEHLGHSLSPRLHSLLGGDGYELWEVPPSELDKFMHDCRFDGMNVTIPYKRAVMRYVDELSETARRVGCVNTVIKRADGSLYGDNTDVYGFEAMACRAGIDFCGAKTLVLGSGGAGLAVRYAVTRAGGEAVVISRSGENNYENIEKHADAEYIVNATPVGMFPNADESPLDIARLPNLKGALDAVYNPLKTRFLQSADARELKYADGLVMLVYQAAKARKLFTGAKVPDELVREAENALRAELAQREDKP